MRSAAIISPLEDPSRWAKLRLLGNSHVVQATIAVPILGYFLLFNAQVVEYLHLHTNFCSGSACGASWRLHFLYFGSFFVAVGASIFAIRCPSVIKIYSGASDFFENEKMYFTAPKNLQYLFRIIEEEKDAPALDPFNMKKFAAENRGVSAEHIYSLADVMGEYYVLQNVSRRRSRYLTFVSYTIGFCLLAVPTVGTFLQVLWAVLP